jgi:hypothetical protein
MANPDPYGARQYKEVYEKALQMLDDSEHPTHCNY